MDLTGFEARLTGCLRVIMLHRNNCCDAATLMPQGVAP
jgi:hypothetical protein